MDSGEERERARRKEGESEGARADTNRMKREEEHDIREK
jgi:hypothetical protein